jgi:beta-glucosidase
MPWRNQVAAIIEAWYPGQMSGRAIADTLFGRVDPTGRLPVTFPASDAQNSAVGAPAQTTGPDNAVEFSEGLLVGYRWYDGFRKRPLFPFGYGLSYTTTKLDGLQVTKRKRGRYIVRVRVRNTGMRSGSEVVQLYLGFPRGSGEPPRQLKAFKKVRLRPGQTRTIKLTLGPQSFQLYDEGAGAWRKQPGTYKVFVGKSSRNLPLRAAIRVKG